MDSTDRLARWARAAAAQLVKSCAERAAREMEAQAGELLLRAARLRWSLE